jgi:hypothetical protein
MREWVSRHIGELPRDDTAFVALETLGSGNLVIPDGEGFLVTHPFEQALKERATRCANELAIPVLLGLTNAFISDATVPLRDGYSTILPGAIDDYKLPANYHKPWDTPDRIDYDCVDRAVARLDALIRDVASGATTKAPVDSWPAARSRAGRSRASDSLMAPARAVVKRPSGV